MGKGFKGDMGGGGMSDMFPEPRVQTTPMDFSRHLFALTVTIRNNYIHTAIYEHSFFLFLNMLGRFAILGWIRNDFAMQIAILILRSRHVFDFRVCLESVC